MPLNPLAFDSKESFEEALLENGLRQGWKPLKLSIEKPGTPEELVDDLIHFGVKGMRWGFRKQEETSNQSSSKPDDKIFKEARAKRRERRAKGHEAVAKKEQKEIDRIRANPSKSSFVQKHRNRQIKEHEKERDLRLKDARDIRAGKLTTFQKKAIVGAAATAAILGAYGGYKLWDTGKGYQLLNSPRSYRKNHLLSRAMSHDEIMKEVVPQINPGFGDLGTKMNCRRCSFAYEMRRRGLDVRTTNTVSAEGQSVLGLIKVTDPNSRIQTSHRSYKKQLWKEIDKGGPVSDALKRSAWGEESVDFGQKFITTKEGTTIFKRSAQDGSEKAERIFDHILRHGDGARGEISVGWSPGGGHSMAWENIKGVTHIFDTQSGKSYDMARFTSELANHVEEAGVTRLDNRALNGDFLGRWIRNAKK